VGEQAVELARRRHGVCLRVGGSERRARLVIAERRRRDAALDQRAPGGLRRVGLVDEEPVALEHVLLARRALVVAGQVLLLELAILVGALACLLGGRLRRLVVVAALV